MNGQDRDFIAPLMQENTTQSWTEAICIAIADLKDKEGKAMQVFLSDDITEHIRLCKQIAKSLRGGEMSFKDLEQKHNLVNRVILACGKHPTDADINPLLEERLERFYEDAVIEGMAKQMHSSVDRAVNTMGRECDVHECRRKVREADDDSSLAGAIVYRR